MSNNILKTLFICFVLFFSALFINVDGVKADNSCATNLKDENGNAIFTSNDQCYNNASQMDTGYALCYYYFDIPIRTEKTTIGRYQSKSEVTIKRHVDLKIQVSKNTSNNTGKSYYAASMTTRCSAEYKDGATDYGNMMNDSNCVVKFPPLGNITAESKVFGKFQNNGKWQCPSSVQVKYNNLVNGNTSTANMQFNGEGSKTITASLWKNASDNTKTINHDTGENVSGGADADASQYANILSWGTNSKEGVYNGYSDNDLGSACGVINGEVKELITTILWFIDIAAIILLIIMTIINFIQALTGMDDEKLRNTFKYFRTRAIVVVVLLLLPVIVGAIINFLNETAGGTVEIGENGEPFCSIDK